MGRRAPFYHKWVRDSASPVQVLVCACPSPLGPSDKPCVRPDALLEPSVFTATFRMEATLLNAGQRALQDSQVSGTMPATRAMNGTGSTEGWTRRTIVQGDFDSCRSTHPYFLLVSYYRLNYLKDLFSIQIKKQ